MTYANLPNLRVESEGDLGFAYRDTGGDGRPVILLQHFRGNLDNWDPALIDDLASARRVITFDTPGVGSSTGATPNTVAQMARDAIAFIAALELAQVDLLGFS